MVTGDPEQDGKTATCLLPHGVLRLVAALGTIGLFALIGYVVGLWLSVFGVIRHVIICAVLSASAATLVFLPWGRLLGGLRRRFRFRLATLLVVVPVAGLVIGLLGRQQLERHQERRSYDLANRVVIRHHGEIVSQQIPGHDPRESFRLWELWNPALTFVGVKLTDEDLRSLAGMKNLGMLHLLNTEVTEEGIMKLSVLPELHFLILDTPCISDESLERIRRGFPGCRVVRRYADLAS